MQFLSSLLLLLAPLTLALPVTDVVVEDSPADAAALVDRQSCFVQCGSTCYTSAQVSAARAAGFSHSSGGTQAGSSNYPHTYNNYEGFDFLVSGPYVEFPLKTSGVYTGGRSSGISQVCVHD